MLRAILSVLVVLSLFMFFLIACEETTTEPGIYSVTLNVTLPEDEDVEDIIGNDATLYLYLNENAVSPIYTSSAEVDTEGFSIEMTEIDEGEYYALLVIDMDGVPASGTVMERGDIIWACMDVDVDGDITINLTEGYLQRYHSVLVGVRGYAAGNIGDIVACALMDDGASYWNIMDNIQWGSYQVLYNQTAVFAISPVDNDDEEEDTTWYEDWMDEELATGDYDLFFLVDEDGTVDDYEGEDDFNPLSPGDQYYEYDFDYDASQASDQFTILTATFADLQYSDITLTVNYTIDAEDYSEVTGDTVALSIWEDIGDEYPVVYEEQVVSSASGTIALDSIPEGTYMITLTIGDEDSDSSEEFIAWGGIDIEITDDLTIAIGDSMWQYVDTDIAIGIRNVPAMYEGELLALALFADAGNYYDFDNAENYIMGGLGYVYNNACLIVMHYNDQYGGEYELESGNYDLAAMIDTNGTIDFYESLSDSTTHMWSPYEIGDPFDLFDMSYDTTDYEDEFQFFTASFDNMLGVTGTVTCPDWTSGGGDIYVLSFYDDPFDTSITDNDPLTWDIITEPGDYSLAVFPDFEGYVVGLWDANDSGLEGEGEDDGGPDAGDYVGAYGESLDSLTLIEVISSVVDSIDFAIDIPYDDSLEH